MSDDLTKALADVLLLVLTTVVPILVAMAGRALAAHTNNQKLRTAIEIAKQIVYAVEQTQEGKAAEVKLHTAMVAMGESLPKRGINLAETQQRALIEAAVHDLRLTWSAVNAPPLPALTPANRQRPKAATTPRRTPAKRAPAKETKA